MKCYTIDTKMNMDEVKYVAHQFNFDFFSYLKQTVMLFHGRHRFLLAESGKLISSNVNRTEGLIFNLLITKVEVLKQRNKRNDQCVPDWKNWDATAMSKVVGNIGCLPPYHEPYKNFSTCSTKEELKEWFKMVPLVKTNQTIHPCQVMPRITFDEINGLENMERGLGINIGYPREAQIITQSRAVDENTLIGNIGGYIGLFLGIS